MTGLCLWLVLRHIEWADAWRTVKKADSGWLLASLVLLSSGYLLRVIRWWLMLRYMSAGLGLNACVGPFLSSIAINNVLPFRAGDVLRTVGFRRHLDIAPIPVMTTLVLERLFDLTVLLGFFFVGLVQVDGRFPHAVVVTTAWMAMGCILLVLLTVLLPHRLQGPAGRLVHMGERRSWRIVRNIGTGAGQFFSSLSILQSSRLLVQLLVLSLGIWGLEGGVFFAVAHALGMTGLGAAPWFALSTGTLGTLLPSTPGYVGTFDYFTMLGLMAYRVDEPTAAIFALVIHLILWFPLTVVGLSWLIAYKLKGPLLPVDIAAPLRDSR